MCKRFYISKAETQVTIQRNNFKLWIAIIQVKLLKIPMWIRHSTWNYVYSPFKNSKQYAIRGYTVHGLYTNDCYGIIFVTFDLILTFVNANSKSRSACHKHFSWFRCSNSNKKQEKCLFDKFLKTVPRSHAKRFSYIPCKRFPVYSINYRVSHETWQYAGRLECRLDFWYNLLRLFVNLIL